VTPTHQANPETYRVPRRQVIGSLSDAGQVALLVGQGALGPTAEDLSWVTGGLGLLGFDATAKMMRGGDALPIIGSNMPYAESLPDPGRVPGIKIDPHIQ
jgi:pyruvate dehydrogenase (quinone)